MRDVLSPAARATATGAAEPAGNLQRNVGRPCPAYRDADRPATVREPWRLGRGKCQAQRRQRHHTNSEHARPDESDVHCPVRPSGLTELARAVKGVDYPYPLALGASRV